MRIISWWMRKSRLSVRRNAWASFHWGNVRVNHIKEKMVAETHRRSPRCGSRSPTSRRAASSCATTLYVSIRMLLCSCLAHYGLKMPECRYLCTVKVSKRVWPELENHKTGLRYPPRCTSDLKPPRRPGRMRGLCRTKSCRRLCAGRASAGRRRTGRKKSVCGSAGFPRWGKRRGCIRRGPQTQGAQRRTARPRAIRLKTKRRRTSYEKKLSG